MKRLIAAVALFGILTLAPVLALAADGCRSQTIIYQGKMVVCTTCCFGGVCSATTCY